MNILGDLKYRSLHIAIALLFCAAAPCVHAITFDWDQSYGTWTQGAPGAGATATQSYSAVDTGHTGADVTISIKNNNSNANWQSGYPQVSSNPNDGATSPVQKGLQLEYSSSNSSGITVTITFNYTEGVNNVVLTLWDVDKISGTFDDRIDTIYARTISGGTVAATLIQTSPDNTLSGTGTNSVVTGTATADNTGANADDGNVVISFNTTEALSSVSFRWTNTSATGLQAITLADFTYTVAPEIGSSTMGMILCSAVLCTSHVSGIVRRRRAAPTV